MSSYVPILPHVSYNPSFNERNWMISQQKGVSEDEDNAEDEVKIEEVDERELKKQKN